MAPVRKIADHEVIRFLFVGVLSFLLEFIIFVVLVDFLKVKYTYANPPAMGVSIIFNYFMTRWLVFKTVRYNNKVSFILFAVVTLVGVVLNQFMLWFLIEQLLMGVKISKVLAVGTVAVFSYFSKKHLVF